MERLNVDRRELYKQVAAYLIEYFLGFDHKTHRDEITKQLKRTSTTDLEDLIRYSAENEKKFVGKLEEISEKFDNVELKEAIKKKIKELNYKKQRRA
ncbi:MAG: hypothetical protein ACP5GD_00795 [Candidatus Micrarchaeia archaeon]|jgi:rubrerythrin